MDNLLIRETNEKGRWSVMLRDDHKTFKLRRNGKCTPVFHVSADTIAEAQQQADTELRNTYDEVEDIFYVG